MSTPLLHTRTLGRHDDTEHHLWNPLAFDMAPVPPVLQPSACPAYTKTDVGDKFHILAQFDSSQLKHVLFSPCCCAYGGLKRLNIKKVANSLLG